MNNPLIVAPINQKLQLSSAANVPLGSGIKVFQVNNEPKAEVQICDSYITTTGSKYCTEPFANNIALGSFCVLTDITAKLWELTASTVAVKLKVSIVGVDENNNEQIEGVEINGTAVINTVGKYKFINDIFIYSGGNIGANQIWARPQGGTPQDQRIVLSGTYRLNWGFMCCNKNGKKRKARLRCINSLYNTVATCNFTLHVFANNLTTGANLGIYTPKYRLYDSTIVTSQGITFPDDGCVELNPGELAVWFRESTTTAITGFSTTWSYYYT